MNLYETLWTICYNLYNLKNVKNTHEGALFLVKLQALAFDFTKSNTPSWLFSRFLRFANGTKSCKKILRAIQKQTPVVFC